MVDEFAEHQEVGEMELAAADGHRTAGLGLHQAALKILDAGDDSAALLRSAVTSA